MQTLDQNLQELLSKGRHQQGRSTLPAAQQGRLLRVAGQLYRATVQKPVSTGVTRVWNAIKPHETDAGLFSRRWSRRTARTCFITAGFPPAIKIDGEIHRAAEQPLTPEQSAVIVRSIMNDQAGHANFDATKECNFAIMVPQGIGRFRVSAFIQQGAVGACAATDHY